MEKQELLSLKVEQKVKSVEDFKFEPIKGFPMLHWKGKRPFTSTQFYPAQLKENYGTEVNSWMNKIYWGDNLQVMSHLIKSFRGAIDLVYIDPPYDSKADYKKKIKIKGAEIRNDFTAFEEKQYTDIWTNDEYLQFMYERLILLRELMSSKGSIFVHCDWHKSHFLRLIMDELFGADNLVNEIIWQRTSAGKSSTNNLPKNTDTIFWYKKTNDFKFYNISVPFTTKDIESFDRDDNDDRGPYNTQPIISPNRRENLIYVYTNKQGKKYMPPPNGWRFNIERMKELEEDKRLAFTEKGIREKNYLNERLKIGKQISNLWTDISGNTTAYSSESLDYPTQKPEQLLERIIKCSSDEGDLVFDCFMGSGTTQEVAMRLGRKFIGADINLGAIHTTVNRLIGAANTLNSQIQLSPRYTGISVFNVNHYDVFRNPLEAKDILLKALEIQPMPQNNLYDGEKDGRMVKVMPINRIATRADLNELITNFDYKSFERLNDKNPGKPVENIMLVCMGHEVDLAAQLQSSVSYKLDIVVVDILRDKSNLEFKRDSEADIIVINRTLEIREFYPLNLLQKLSMEKQSVTEWRELVDSVMIDFNYDGAVLEPHLVDIPEEKKFVKGVYEIPENAGTIRVKITDLLSESLEISISTNG
jgi:adenine-specific DNA-methyltransferase